MRGLVVMMLILIFDALHGQNNISTTPQKNDNLFIGINCDFNQGYRIASTHKNLWYFDFSNTQETPIFAYTMGLNLNYRISKKISLEMGGHYSKKWSTTKKTETNYELMGYGFVDALYYEDLIHNGSLPTHLTNNYTAHYLDIPIRAMLRFGKKKIQWVTSIGISTNILMRDQHINTYYYGDGYSRNLTYEEQNRSFEFNITPTISAGVSTKISDKIKLNIEPTFRYGLYNIHNYYIPSEILWSVGLNATCYYLIK